MFWPFRVTGARDCALCQKWEKMWGFASISKNDGRRGTFEEDLERCILRGRRNTRNMSIRDVRRSGRWFPETGCILEHQIFRFAKMILRDRCSTSYDLEKSQNALVRGRQLCAQLSILEGSLAELFRFWHCQAQKLRNSRRQNCLVFDVVNFESWRKSRRMLRFWCCQVQNLRRSRTLASFLTLSRLSSWNIEGHLAE